MSPRERFRANKDFVTGYNDIIDSARMVAAFDAAMLEFFANQTISACDEMAGANAYRLEGAQRFLKELKNLNTEFETGKTSGQHGLRHNV